MSSRNRPQLVIESLEVDSAVLMNLTGTFLIFDNQMIRQFVFKVS